MVTPLTAIFVRCALASAPLAEQPMDSLRRLDGSSTALRCQWPPCADDLVAAPPEIPDRRAPHVHQAREREEQEYCHSKEQMRFENGMRIGHQHPCVGPEQQRTLRPIHE